MSQWQLLSVFNTVAEESSFSGAAKRLELTQPTVSFHIDNLEKTFGCPLFQRTARGVKLTVYGEALFAHTSKIKMQLETAYQQLQYMRRGESGEIHIGASTIPAEYILPKLIAEFLRAKTGLQIFLHTGNSETIMNAYATGEFPIAIVGVLPENGSMVLKLWSDEIVLIAHPDTASLLGKSPSLDAVFSHHFVSRPSSSGSLRTVRAALKEQGISPERMHVVLNVNGNEAVKSAVMNKIGLGYISKWAVQNELQSGALTIVQVPGLTITRRFYAVCQPPPLLNCFQVFWDFLEQQANLLGNPGCAELYRADSL